MKAFTYWLLITVVFSGGSAGAQSHILKGRVSSANEPVQSANIVVVGSNIGASTDTAGFYTIVGIPAGTYIVKASAIGYKPMTKQVTVAAAKDTTVDFYLTADEASLTEVVVTGTMKEVSRLESPVPVEVYNQGFFKKNPTPSIFDALQNVNGVRPQLNCNVCNTGDIHINGLEGPYTMVLIDGMPLVSGLSSVYGLSGIPNALIERVEIVKGPASSLYGSEAVGGLINIITRKPQNAPLFYSDVFATSWQEVNADIGFKLRPIQNAIMLTGINYFKYGNRVDHNNDNFTDVTQQDRVSFFQKWSFQRLKNRHFTLAGRYSYEDRWGGDMGWNKSFRGGEEVYGESIYTNRWEVFGTYQLPFEEPITLGFSYNDHAQNSVYGNTPYLAAQRIGFSQVSWDKHVNKHDLLLGAGVRYTFYDDNTPATAHASGILNKPNKVWLPGFFIQDEIELSKGHRLLLGIRYDRNSVHGNILTPRLAYKWTINDKNIFRFNAGTGFRVVSLFTEEHAALTGAREVIVSEELAPERSYNANLNYIKKVYFENGGIVGIDASLWYTHFNNQIIPDYLTDPNKIIYGNLHGYAISKGISANVDMAFTNGLKVLAGGSLLDVFSHQKEGTDRMRNRPLLTEKWTGTWSVSYIFQKLNLGIDYTGNIYGPMRLPRLGNSDPRSAYSPVWSIQNVQLTYLGGSRLELYGGIKNILNWTPGRKEPFLIARSFDPFDKQVQYDIEGNVIATTENPYALTFDPSSVYAPNQGLRAFLGVRINIR